MDTENYLFPCLFKTFFGIDCPGCGLQRAIILLLKGDFLAAFNMFPAIYILLTSVLIFIFHKLIHKEMNAKTIVILTILNGLLLIGGYLFKNL